MSRALGLLRIVALTALPAAVATFAATPASAVVYCKTVGYPQGCVVRPAPVVVVPRAVVVTPAPVVVTPRVGYPVGAPGVGYTGVPGNRGGPVNRVGRY